MWKIILASLVSSINFYSVLFFIFSNIRWPFVKKLVFNPNDNVLQNGDILLTRRDWFLKNLIVPGRYKHVGVYNEREVLEMQNDGYQETPVEYFFSNYTEIAVYRPKDPAFAEKFIKEIRTFSKVEYDSRFSLNHKNMYCSEMIHVADVNSVLKYKPRKFFWLLIFAPDDISKLETLEEIGIYS